MVVVVKIDCGQSFFVVSHYSWFSSSAVGCSAKLIDRGARPSSSPSLSPRVGVGLGLGLVYLVLEHEVFREARLRSSDKILCSDWSRPS